MNENVERLRELKADLERLEREHSEALGIEPTIGRPLHQAADEARRKFKTVSEGRVGAGVINSVSD